MTALLLPADLEAFAQIDTAKAQAMIEDAIAEAVLVAPCLSDPDALDEHLRAAAKAVLRSVVLRWEESGYGGQITTRSQSATAGQMTYTTATTAQPAGENVPRGGRLWPTDIDRLQAVCRAASSSDLGGRAFGFDLFESAAPPIAHPFTLA